MSTKIFNGYYLDVCSLQELQTFSMFLRAKIKTKSEEIYAKKLLELATYYYDNPIFQEKYCPLFQSKMEIDKRSYAIKETNLRDPQYDFTFDITFIPTSSKILVLVYTEQPEYIKIFESFPNVHPYPYYNNIDKPNNITEPEWEERGLEWDNALQPYDIPSLQGFSISCVVYLPFFTIEELSKYSSFIITFSQRLNKLAREQHWSLFYNRYVKHYHSEPTLSKYFAWSGTKSGLDKFTQIKNKLMKQLKPVITIDDLLEDLK